MDLLRVWRRQLLQGAVAAFVAPVAMLAAAFSVGVFGGGLGSLGSLAQAVSGPGASGLDAVAAESVRTGDEAARLLGRRGRGTASAVRRRPADAPARSRRGDRRSGVRRETRRPTDRRAPRPAQPVTRPRPTSSPAPPPPAPERSIYRQVGDRVKEVTNQVPVVREPAGQVVDQIVATAESLPQPDAPQP